MSAGKKRKKRARAPQLSEKEERKRAAGSKKETELPQPKRERQKSSAEKVSNMLASSRAAIAAPRRFRALIPTLLLEMSGTRVVQFASAMGHRKAFARGKGSAKVFP